MQPHHVWLIWLNLGKIWANLGKIWANLDKIKILHPEKHSISYGYVSQSRGPISCLF